jgi:tetratricopeptide (TPR) repeat protein
LSGGNHARRERPEEASFALILARAAEMTAQKPQERAQRRAAAAPLLDELMALPEFLRRAAIENEPRFRILGLADLLLRAGETPATGELPTPADLALTILVEIELQQPDLPDLLGLLVMARCARADEQRRAGNLSAAENEFRILIRRLASEPIDGPERAIFCRYLALLRADQGRHDEALALLERASSLFGECNETTAAAESLSERAWLLLDGGDPVGALGEFERALPLLYDAEWPQLAIRTCHGLALSAAELGDADKAETAIAGARALYEEVPAAERLRFLLVEARVAEHGQAERAIAWLEPAVGGFLIEEAHHDAATAAVALARLYAAAGRRADVERLRQEVAPLIEQGALPEQARAVVLFAFLFAGRRGQDVSGLLEEASGFLARSRENPRLEFRPEGAGLSKYYWDQVDSGVRRLLCRDAGLPASVTRLSPPYSCYPQN